MGRPEVGVRSGRVVGAVLAAVAFGSLAWAGETPAAKVEVSSRLVDGRHLAPISGDDLERDLATYRIHLTLLADPAMEGRAPGTNGNRIAANYIEGTFRRLGLTPAFRESGHGGEASYRQVFEAKPSERPGDSIRLNSQSASYTTADGVENVLRSDVDFNALGHSASAEATGPLVFVGYSVESEAKKYRSIPEGTDLSGKIAVVLRLEPMNEEGKSLWAEDRWSFQAGLEMKLNTVAASGAAGIILVNPPGADHDQTNVLADISLGSRRHQKVPVVMLSGDAADALLKAADAEGRGLMDLRKLADNLGEGESGVIELPNATVTLKADIARIPLMTDNVGAILPGTGVLADEFVVVGAHYDHVGYGYFGSRGGPEARGTIHPGADDNASGTSGLLLIAENLAREYAKMPASEPRRCVLFLAFSAEESGLEGSKFYVKNAVADQAKHTLMVNLDMIGRCREGRLDVQGTSTGDGMLNWLTPAFEQSGLSVVPTPGGSGPSDHASFYGWGVPVLFFFTRTHEEYHKPQDVIATINMDDATRIADLAGRVLLDAALLDKGFTYVGMGKPADPHAGASTDKPGPVGGGVRVRFGIAPGDYSGSEKGVLVGEVYPNTPAAKAGIQKDDIITHWNGKEILDVEAWMPFLSDAKPGDRVVITLKRRVGDESHEVTADVELVARGTPMQ